MTNKSNGKKKNVSNTKQNNVNKKQDSIRNIKPSVKLDENENKFSIFKVIFALVLILIVIFIFVKACQKNEKEEPKKDKKENKEVKEEVKEETKNTKTQKTVDYVINTNDYVETPVQIIETMVSNVETEDIQEGIVIDNAPKVTGISDNEIYSGVYINAIDDITTKENLISTIDGESYELDSFYNKIGRHIFKVVDESNNETTIEFIIAKVVNNYDEYIEQINDSSIESIMFSKDFETENFILPVNRSVILTAETDTELPVSFEIKNEEEMDAETEEVDTETKELIKLELRNINLNINTFEIDEEEQYTYAIKVMSSCDAEVVLKNTNINVNGENKNYGLLIINHRSLTKIDIIDSTINNISESEEESAGIKIKDETEEESENSINIENSEINGFDYPVLMDEKSYDENETVVDDESSFTDESEVEVPKEDIINVETELGIENASELNNSI